MFKNKTLLITSQYQTPATICNAEDLFARSADFHAHDAAYVALQRITKGLQI